MINVNQMTAQLAKMPDHALQQYAAMHKNDPYTMALALAESNRRKEIRNSADMGAGQQPSVVDQEIVGMAAAQPVPMLPEDQGIGQLPAQNLQKMAGGGIVAFEEGGEVPHFDGTAGSRVYDPMNPESPFAIGTAYRKWKESGLPLLPYLGISTTVPAPATANTPVKPAVDQTTAETARLAAQNQNATGTPVVGLDALAQAKADADKAVADKVAAEKAAAPAGTGIAGGYEKKFLDMLSKGEVSKEDRIKEMTDINKPVLEKMTTLIEDNKNKLKTEGEQNFYMSLIQGGLAAAGASGPNALQNLAQGFEKGASQYSEGLKDLRKAARENTKMELSMAEYEATGKKDALKSYYDHQDKVQGYKAQGLASIMGHEISASATAAHAGAQERLIDRIGRDPKFAESYNKYLTSGAEAKLMPQLAAQYAKDPMKLEMLKQTDPMQYQQIKAYLNQQMVPAAMSAPSGNVRP